MSRPASSSSDAEERLYQISLQRHELMKRWESSEQTAISHLNSYSNNLLLYRSARVRLPPHASHALNRSLQAKGFVSLDLEEPALDEATLYLELSQAQLALQVSLQKQNALCSKMAANDNLLQFQLDKLDVTMLTPSGATFAQIGKPSWNVFP